MPAQIEMFSEVRIALMKEVREHPPLVEILARLPRTNTPDDWPIQLAEIAAYVVIVVDGEYMPSELEGLYRLCFFKLKEKRAIIVNKIMETKQ